MKPTANSSPGTRPLGIDLIGARGHNAMHRVLPALAPYAGALDFAGYDLVPGPERVHGLPVEQIRDDADLARRLRQRRPDVVWIETPDDVHPAHIELALASGAPLVLCEKCIAADTQAGGKVLRRCRRAAPHQQVRFIDHYLSLPLVRTLHANTTDWLGEVKEVRVVLLESQGVPPHQERSHAKGMTNFFHHVLGVAALWFDLDDLIPVEAGWARHPAARVPDTYREARFRSVRRGAVVLKGVVGKYAPRPAKTIHVHGSRGRARIDRDRNQLHVTSADGRPVTWPGANGDTGYADLARALATGTALPALLAPAQALQVLRLVEQAQARARPLVVYADTECDGGAFVCDWEVACLGPDRV